MKRAMITVAEERLLQLERRSELWHAEGRIDETQRSAIQASVDVPWVSRGLLASIALFILTVLAVLAAGWFADEVLPFSERLVIAVASLVVAELLIRRFRWWSTGVEQALWLCGLFALILSMPGEGTPEALLLFAAAAFIAGLRLRSAPLGVLGVLIVAGYVETKGEWFEWRDYYSEAAMPFPIDERAAAVALAVASALAGIAALRREWKRPSTEWFWSGVVVFAPAAFLFASHFPETPYVTGALAAVLAAPLLAAGLVMRHHAPIVSALILGVIAGSDLLREELIPGEILLAIFGVLFLATSFAMSRVLGGRTAGIVATPAKLTVVDDEVQTVGAFGAEPHHAEPPPDAGPSGGGSFGGAGATGEY